VKVLLVVEDDADIRMLITLKFSLDPDFVIAGEAGDVVTAVEIARSSPPDLIVLDHRLGDGMSGLDGAPLLKEAAPASKIILFSASEELRVQAASSPHVDAFLLKTRIERLVPLSRELLGLAASGA
jgi:DNA-binding NarL/FixJ family response regulator